MKEEVFSRDGRGAARFARRLALGSLVVLGLAALGAARVQAAKPPGGGGGGVGGGTIYYSVGQGLWSMNPDGSGKTLLPVAGTPSRLLHGGYRWFLQRRPVAGLYPDGGPRAEFFAVRGDGNELFTRQLTDSPYVELRSGGTWLPGDTGISEIGRELVAGEDCSIPPYPELNPCVVEGGIYDVDVHFDGGGNVDSLPADPWPPIVVIELFRDPSNQDTWPNAKGNAWSPNAEEIAYQYDLAGSSQYPLKIVVVATGDTRVLTGDGNSPQWSPDGSKIKFGRYNSIWTIAPDGAGEVQILAGSGSYLVGGGDWSPTGSHVTYGRVNPGCYLCNPPTPDVGDVYRATAAGGSRTNLTGDIGGMPSPRGWR